MNTNVPLMLAVIVASAFVGLTACSQQNDNQKVASNPFVSSSEPQEAESVHPVATIATNYGSTQSTSGVASTANDSSAEATLAATPATTKLAVPAELATPSQLTATTNTTAAVVVPEATVSENVAQATVAPETQASTSVMANTSIDTTAVGSTETQALAAPTESVKPVAEENHLLDHSTDNTSNSSLLSTPAPQSATAVTEQ